METETATLAFATLGHPDRLAVFRLLMRFAPRGVRPTEIAQALDLKPNTLSHYLSDLTTHGLAEVRRDGRSLFYSANLSATRALISYLACDVGRGRPDLTDPLAARPKAHKPGPPFNVLFLCSGNSARSIFAEALLRDLGQGKFRAFSAGTRAGSSVNPVALRVLERNGHDTSGLHPKQVSEFQHPGAPPLDFVFTVCDTAAAEDCPPWVGQPLSAHWGLPDPVKAHGSDAEKALTFAQTYGALRRRISAFVELPFDRLSRKSLQAQLEQIDTQAILTQES